jgi:hypothetical protein
MQQQKDTFWNEFKVLTIFLLLYTNTERHDYPNQLYRASAALNCSGS